MMNILPAIIYDNASATLLVGGKNKPVRAFPDDSFLGVQLLYNFYLTDYFFYCLRGGCFCCGQAFL
jgi:hypothetical protein